MATNSILGNFAGSSGTYSLSGNGQLSANGEYVGGNTSTFTQSGGRTVAGNLSFSATNLVRQRHVQSQWPRPIALSPEWRVCGKLRHGNLHAVRRNPQYQQLSLCSAETPAAAERIASAAPASWRPTKENVGNDGMGNFTQSGGANIVSFLAVGNLPGSSGTYRLSGSGLLSASYETVGVLGTGAVTQISGTDSIGSELLIGAISGSGGTA